MAARTGHPPTADRSPRYPGGPVRCGVRGCGCEDPRVLLNAANAVTVLRTLASLGLVIGAAVAHSWPLLLAAYLTYWIGDSADGRAGWRGRKLVRREQFHRAGPRPGGRFRGAALGRDAL